MEFSSSVVLQPAKSLFIIPLVATIVIAIGAMFSETNTLWITAAVMIIVTGICYLAYKKKLLINESGIVQETITGKTAILWQNVTKVYLLHKKYGKSSSVMAILESPGNKDFKILFDTYGNVKRQKIASAIIANLKMPAIDQRIHMLANGDFKVNYQDGPVYI